MDKTIKELKQIWEEILYRSMIPINASEEIDGIHIGMFEIHGHYIDKLTELIESLGV